MLFRLPGSLELPVPRVFLVAAGDYGLWTWPLAEASNRDGGIKEIVVITPCRFSPIISLGTLITSGLNAGRNCADAPMDTIHTDTQRLDVNQQRRLQSRDN